jgi:hypothetical protein
MKSPTGSRQNTPRLAHAGLARPDRGTFNPAPRPPQFGSLGLGSSSVVPPGTAHSSELRPLSEMMDFSVGGGSADNMLGLGGRSLGASGGSPTNAMLNRGGLSTVGSNVPPLSPANLRFNQGGSGSVIPPTGSSGPPGPRSNTSGPSRTGRSHWYERNLSTRGAVRARPCLECCLAAMSHEGKGQCCERTAGKSGRCWGCTTHKCTPVPNQLEGVGRELCRLSESRATAQVRSSFILCNFYILTWRIRRSKVLARLGDS